MADRQSWHWIDDKLSPGGNDCEGQPKEQSKDKMLEADKKKNEVLQGQRNNLFDRVLCLGNKGVSLPLGAGPFYYIKTDLVGVKKEKSCKAHCKPTVTK